MQAQISSYYSQQKHLNPLDLKHATRRLFFNKLRLATKDLKNS